MKLLFFDIETSPLLVYTWGLYDQNIGLNQVVEDWSVLSWAAKWQDSKNILYDDNRNARNIRDDKRLLKGIWRLLNEADVVVTQNGKQFDQKKLNARFNINDMRPPSSFQHIDTRLLAKKHFGFTSNSLEYMSGTLNTKYKKLKHKKFPGQELWNECLKKNPEAWEEMEKYNKHDVLALEELYNKLSPWDTAVNFSLYTDGKVTTCSCGNTDFKRNGHAYTSTGKFQRYECKRCGAEFRSRSNILSEQKKGSLLVGTKR
jgi:DNA polymerase elongation subunit (family B)